MSIHGTCHDEGNSGNCGRECRGFINGECTIPDEIEERFPEEEEEDMQCDTCHKTDEYHECIHAGPNKDTKVEGYMRSGTAPTWCPINLKAHKVDQRKHKLRRDNMSDEKRFDFDKSTAQVKDNAMDSFATAKKVIVQLQQGKAVLTVVKSALKRAPGSPDSLKLLLDTAYGDLVVGMILQTMAPVLTGSPIIMKAVKAANIAGAVEVSQQFTFIQDAIEGAIAQIPDFATLKGLAENKIGEAVGGQADPIDVDEPTEQE